MITTKPETFSRGISLIEAVVYVAIFTVAMLAIMSSVSFFYNTNRYTLEQSTQVDAARIGVAAMVKDIREADYADTGAFPLISAGANDFSFYSDIDGDGSKEKVRFFVSANDFMTGVTESAGIPPVYSGAESISMVAQYVRNIENGTPIFRYYDNAGAEITNYTNVSKIVFVKVDLVVNVNPETLPNEFDLHSSASIRNLKTNL